MNEPDARGKGQAVIFSIAIGSVAVISILFIVYIFIQTRKADTQTRFAKKFMAEAEYAKKNAEQLRALNLCQNENRRLLEELEKLQKKLQKK